MTVKSNRKTQESTLIERTKKKKDQVRKGVRRMPCHSRLKKDAQNCEKRRQAERKRSRRYPNGETRHAEKDVTLRRKGLRGGTRGTETSKYPEEKKTKVISQVAASEREEAQTVAIRGCRRLNEKLRDL